LHLKSIDNLKHFFQDILDSRTGSQRGDFIDRIKEMLEQKSGGKSYSTFWFVAEDMEK
jgi:hypothetical protein